MRILSWHSLFRAAFIAVPGPDLGRGYRIIYARLYGIRAANRPHLQAFLSRDPLAIEPGNSYISKRWMQSYRSGSYRYDETQSIAAAHASYDYDTPSSPGLGRGAHRRGAGLVTAASRRETVPFRKRQINEYKPVASPPRPIEETSSLYIPSTRAYSYGQKVVARIAYFNDKGAVVSVDDGERNGFIPKLDVMFYQDAEGVNLSRGDQVTAYVGRQTASSSSNVSNSSHNMNMNDVILDSNTKRIPNSSTHGDDIKGTLAMGKSRSSPSRGPVGTTSAAGFNSEPSGGNFLVLHLRKVGDTGREDAATSILSALQASSNGSLPIGDKSTPDAIYDMFKGMSKKIFKDALGRLFKQGLVVPTDDSVYLKSKHPNMVTRNMNTTSVASGACK